MVPPAGSCSPLHLTYRPRPFGLHRSFLPVFQPLPYDATKELVSLSSLARPFAAVNNDTLFGPADTSRWPFRARPEAETLGLGRRRSSKMRRILVPLDGSGAAEAAVKEIEAICEPGDEVVLISVSPPAGAGACV